ncbi:MAG: transglycosylase SLT domain-containing protein [Myxococcota bacterium]
MTQQERWDVALKVLQGPLAGLGEQVLRGPVVRLGADPGPGGLKLAGYRGLDVRQCVITAYSGGSASVAPVGTNQVRMAPHPNVNWSEIDPMVGPEFLSPGCALHLGPIGRGATIEYVGSRRLGEWQSGQLASERVDVPTGARGDVPAAYDARRVGRISSSSAPFWFLGGSFMVTLMSTGCIVTLVVWALFLYRPVAPIGPEDAGYEFYESVTLDAEESRDYAHLLEGMEQPYFKFVMEPNITAANAGAKGWEEPSQWDQRLLKYVTASADAHAKSWLFFRRLDAVSVEYAKVVLAMREAGLPEVFAAIPYQESRYNAQITSEVCAEGYWQFMPEVAHRLSKQGLDFRVADCKFVGTSGLSWTPSDPAPPPGVRQNAAYMGDGRCLIKSCNVDDRKDLGKSTKAAVYTLKEAWRDPVIALSGAAVQLTITSHNSGLDDGRFGKQYAKKSNVKPAFQAFVKKNGPDVGRSFVGQNIRCGTAKDEGYCNASYPAETQHYAYTILAQHFLAVCYYAKNYGEQAAFTPWRFYAGSDGYCDAFRIPTRTEVRDWKPQGGK